MCEFISAPAMELALAHLTNSRRPFAAPAYVLIEFSAQDETTDIEAILEHALSAAMDASCMTEAVIARNLRERDALIALRDVISDAELAEGGAVKHDISVPISEIPAAIRAVEGLIERRFPDCRLNVFGHIGDGNLHVNLRPPAGQTLSDLVPRSAEITRAVEEIAVALGGSFSAEHGIGQMRLTGMANHKSAVELDLMRAIKHALDPDQLLNPGKMLP
jgi:FAD/FMN-containing dehydrogenase